MPGDKITQALIKGVQGAKELTTVKVEYSPQAEKTTKTVIYTLAGAVIFNGLANIFRALKK